MHIRFDMTRSPGYTAQTAPRSEDIHIDSAVPEGTRSGESPSTFTPYSAASNVSSFNYPATTDSTLLTPVSGASSPQMPADPPPKNMPSYHGPQPSVPQQPTPPSTSRLYFSGYGINDSSLISPQMRIASPPGEAPFDLNNYVNVAHSPNSTEQSIPHPPEPYMANYTVSAPDEGEEMHVFPQYHFIPQASVDPAFVMRQTELHHPTMHPRLFSGSPGPAPLLTQPFRRASGIEDLIAPPGQSFPLPSEGIVTSGPRAHAARRRPRGSRSRGGGRKTSRNDPSNAACRSQPAGTVSDNGDGAGEAPELTLESECPEEAQYLFRLRKRFGHERGRGMWDDIGRTFSERYGAQDKATLQMKVHRAINKYGIWPEDEVQLLLEAYQHDEETRYQRMLEYMKEAVKKRGTSLCWDWRPAHIEVKLVKMGLEELVADEAKRTRKRKKITARQQMSMTNTQAQRAVLPLYSWTGIGVSHSGAANPHDGSARRPASYGVLTGDGLCRPAPLTSEQQDELIDQVYKYRCAEPEPDSSASPSPTAMDDYDELPRAENIADDVNTHDSRRVARQACEQIMIEEGLASESGYVGAQP